MSYYAAADAADLFACLDADVDFSGPLTPSDLGLQQFDQHFNRANQGVWQCSNCCAINDEASQRFVRGLDDSLTCGVKRASGVSQGFGDASGPCVPRADASMCCVMRQCACGHSVHGGLGSCVILRDAASQCSILTDTSLEVPYSNEVPSSPDLLSSDSQHSSFSPAVHSSLYFDDDAQDLYINSVLGFTDKAPETGSALPSPVNLHEIGRELDKWFEESVDLGAVLDGSGSPLSSSSPPQASLPATEAVPSPAQIFQEIVSECELIERRSNPSSPVHDAQAAEYSPQTEIVRSAFYEDHYYTLAQAPPSAGPTPSPAPSSPSVRAGKKRAAGICLAELTVDELTERKRQQNREAAARYRKKQKTSHELAIDAVAELEKRNADLRGEATELESKIATLRELIFNRVLDGKGSVPK